VEVDCHEEDGSVKDEGEKREGGGGEGQIRLCRSLINKLLNASIEIVRRTINSSSAVRLKTLPRVHIFEEGRKKEEVLTSDF
jgi:hypothetical protein